MNKLFLLILILLTSLSVFSQNVRHDQLRTPSTGNTDSVVYFKRNAVGWELVKDILDTSKVVGLNTFVQLRINTSGAGLISTVEDTLDFYFLKSDFQDSLNNYALTFFDSTGFRVKEDQISDLQDYLLSVDLDSVRNALSGHSDSLLAAFDSLGVHRDSLDNYYIYLSVMVDSAVSYNSRLLALEGIDHSTYLLKADFGDSLSNYKLTDIDSSGFRITESQIIDLDHFTNVDETDHVYANDSAYIKSNIKDWIGSLAKTIDVNDTTWWGNKDYGNLTNTPSIGDSISDALVDYLLKVDFGDSLGNYILTFFDSTGFTLDTSQIRNLLAFVQNNAPPTDLTNYFTKSETSQLFEDSIATTTLDEIMDGIAYVRSTNNFTNTYKTKLDGIEALAEVNVQTDYNETNDLADDYLVGRELLALKSDTSVYLETIHRTDSLVLVLADSINARLDSTASINRFSIDSVWQESGMIYIKQGDSIYTAASDIYSPQLGDFFQGGYIFYISLDSTWGYCAAPQVLYTAVDGWELSPYTYKGTSGLLGTGQANTNTIILAEGTGNYAASIAANYSYTSYNDYWLPSIAELDSVYEVLKVREQLSYLNFIAPWSSTDVSSTNAYYLAFGNGNYVSYGKDNVIGVLPVRRWEISAENTLPIGSSGDIIYHNGTNWASLSIGSEGQVIKVASGFPSWGAVSGSGTVTSFSSGNLSPLFTTSVANSTTTPALSFTLSSQTANRFFAAPNGSNGNPTFRSIASTDLPTSGVSAGSYTNTNLTVDAYGRITAASNGPSTGYTLPTASPTTKGGFQVFANTEGYYMSGDYLIISSDKHNEGTPTTSSYIAFHDGTDMYKATISDILGLGSGSITVRETDGAPSYSSINTLEFTGATLTQPSAGIARLSITGGSMDYPTGSGIPIIVGGSSWGTTISPSTGYLYYNGSTYSWGTPSGGMVYPSAGIAVSTGSAWGTSKTAPSGAIVGTTDSQSLTNKSVNGVTLTDAEEGSSFLADDGNYKTFVPQSITTTADITNGYNFKTTASSDKTITFSNLFEGASGQIEVSYYGASKITFASSGYTVKIASNIYDSAAKVTSKSSGVAIYSYYVSNSIIYINGTQSYN